MGFGVSGVEISCFVATDLVNVFNAWEKSLDDTSTERH
jgi:hypothetical protein